MSTKSSADNVKEAAKGETDPKAMSAAAATDSPPKGDGKAPYRDDMEAIYHRLDTLEQAVALLAERLTNIERRLQGVVSE